MTAHSRSRSSARPSRSRPTTAPEPDPLATDALSEERFAHDERAYGEPPPRGRGPDLSPLFHLLDALRAGLPRDVDQQFRTLVREVLLTLRALIDWYLDRLDRDERRQPVEDIPID